MLWSEDSADVPRSLAGVVKLFSTKTSTSLKSATLVAFPVHVVKLNFGKEYKKRLIQSRYSLVGYVPVELKRVKV